MSSPAHLLAIRFDEPLKAQECLIAALRLQKRGSVTIDDAAIVTNEEGKVRIHQTKDMNTGQGAATGGWFGALAGLLFLQPLAGAVLGAAIGGLWAKLRDIGIDDDQMRRMGESLADGEGALFLLLEESYPTHIARELGRFDGTVLFSSFDETDTQSFAAALATEV
jgi:uncharacterized membrane protein